MIATCDIAQMTRNHRPPSTQGACAGKEKAGDRAGVQSAEEVSDQSGEQGRHPSVEEAKRRRSQIESPEPLRGKKQQKGGYLQRQAE